MTIFVQEAKRPFNGKKKGAYLCSLAHDNSRIIVTKVCCHIQFKNALLLASLGLQIHLCLFVPDFLSLICNATQAVLMQTTSDQVITTPEQDRKYSHIYTELHFHSNIANNL